MLNERSEDRIGMTKNKPLLVISNVERNLKKMNLAKTQKRKGKEKGKSHK
jgi:hypothetical protein